MINPYWANVTFVGEVTSQIVNDLYSIANIGVMPSLQEQCSIASIEMRFHKVPQIVSAVEGFDELYEDNYDALKITARYDEDQNIYFSFEEIKDKILLLLEDESLSTYISTNAYKKGKELFTAELMASKYNHVFSSFFQDEKK